MNAFFTPKVHEDKPFELVPEGKHAAIVKYVVDCGHHHDKDMQGADIIKHLVFIGFQLPEVLNSEGTPHWKGDFFTVTDFKSGKGYLFHKNSKFNKLLRSWTNEDGEKVQWLSFLEDLVARETPAYMTIEHSPSKDGTKTYSNIISLKPYTGKKAVKMDGPLVVWTFGQDGFEDLPGNIKKKIEASIEKTQAPAATPASDNEPDDSNFPF